jgi:VWFA-related protein
MGTRLLVVAMVAACTPILAQDQRAPTFSAAINYVEFSVRVVDGRGNFVRDLQQSDFRVLEDGNPQSIARFELVDVPLPNAMAPANPASPAGQPLTTETLQQLDGRLYIFLLDDYHVPSEHSSRAKGIVRSFIGERLGSTDAATVVFASGVRGQGFTDDRKLLLSAVDRFRGVLDYRAPASMKELRARAVVQTMRDLATALEPIQGRRKALVYVGITVGCLVAQETRPQGDAGFAGNARVVDLSSAGTGEAPDARTTILCQDEITQAVRGLTRAGTVVYSLDPRGSYNPAWISPTVDGRGGPGPARDRMSLVEAGRPSVFDGFNVFADRTGGFAVTGTSAYDSVLDRIVQENSSYYVIGYYSTNDTAEGTFRNNQVTISRSQLKAFHRPGYFAPR